MELQNENETSHGGRIMKKVVSKEATAGRRIDFSTLWCIVSKSKGHVASKGVK